MMLYNGVAFIKDAQLAFDKSGGKVLTVQQVRRKKIIRRLRQDPR